MPPQFAEAFLFHLKPLGHASGTLFLLAVILGPTDQLVGLFVPKVQEDGFETTPKSDRNHLMEDLIFVMSAFEIVVWDLGGKMVYMMKADVAAEPLGHLIHFEE